MPANPCGSPLDSLAPTALRTDTADDHRDMTADHQRESQVPGPSLEMGAAHEAVAAPIVDVEAIPVTRLRSVSFARELSNGLPELERALTDRIRREFFARAAEPAARYGVTMDDLLAHLRDAHLALTPGPARVLSYLDDVALAVACVRGHPRAWSDAWQKHESALIRACNTRLDDADAVVFTRRFWISLYTTTVTNRESRHSSTTAESAGQGGAVSHHGTSAAEGELWPIAAYVGVRPLRNWLTERLMGLLEHAVVRASRGAAGSPTSPWMPEGFVFRALRRRTRAPRGDIRLRLVD